MDRDKPLYSSPFELIAKDANEAKHLEVRADLLLAIRDIVEMQSLSAKQVAEILGISQPRVSELLNGKVRRFSIDTLVNYMQQLGYDLIAKQNVGKLQLCWEVSKSKKPEAKNNTRASTLEPALAN